MRDAGKNKNLLIIISSDFSIRALNLMCEIGMNFYQYWHHFIFFQDGMSYTIKESSACHY